MRPVAYSLTKTDTSSVGGPMRLVDIRELWTHYLCSIADCKYVAESDYGKKIKWLTDPKPISSDNLRWIEYTIRPIFVRPIKEILSELPVDRTKPRKKPAAK